MILTVRKHQGYDNVPIDQLMNEYKEYWFMVLSLTDMNFKKARKYYKKYKAVDLVRMNTDKLAANFDEPDIQIQEEYKKIKGL